MYFTVFVLCTLIVIVLDHLTFLILYLSYIFLSNRNSLPYCVYKFYFSQFDCTNTLNDQVLEDVFVQMESSDDYEVVDTVKADKLSYNTPGTTYTIVEVPGSGAGSVCMCSRARRVYKMLFTVFKMAGLY